MKKIYLLLPFLILVSCTPAGAVYDKFIRMSETNQWKKEDIKTFEIDIKEDGNYTINFDFSHVYDYQFNKVPIVFEIENESGNKETIPVDLKIKDESGKQLADCSGDICDLKYTVKDNFPMKKGKHKIMVSNTFLFEYLPNVIGIGITVSHSKE